ncbi:MAG: hypothetical protein WC714_20220 [Candidatus Obscuribacterales bacterium]|jgi:hypothetical protein
MSTDTNFNNNTADFQFAMAVIDAERRIQERYDEAVRSSGSYLFADQYGANEQIVCWGTPSRAQQAQIAARYHSKMAAATSHHEQRLESARSARDNSNRALSTLKASYQSMADRTSLVASYVSRVGLI